MNWACRFYERIDAPATVAQKESAEGAFRRSD